MLQSASLSALDATRSNPPTGALPASWQAGHPRRVVRWAGGLSALVSLSELMEWGWLNTRSSEEHAAISSVCIALAIALLGPAMAMWTRTDALHRALQGMSPRVTAAWWVVGLTTFLMGYARLLGALLLGGNLRDVLPLSAMLVLMSSGTAALPWRGGAGRLNERLLGPALFALIAPLSYGVVQRLSENVWSPSIVMTVLAVSAFLTAASLAALRWLHLDVVASRDEEHAALCRLERELEAMRKSRDLAEQRAEQRTRFLARLSHELRTPLTTMVGFSQLLDIDVREPLSAGQRHKNSYVVKSGALLQRLVDDMSNLSDADKDDFSVERKEVQVRGIVETVAGLMAPVACRHGVDLKEPSVGEGCRVWGDEQRLIQILLNLVGNAIKYNRQGGVVWITVERRYDLLVEIGVHDSGHGIDSSRMSQLFEPFNRLGRETSDIPGTGLGLAHCKLLAALMGGHIEATSQLDQGTHMTLTLPAVADPPCRQALT